MLLLSLLLVVTLTQGAPLLGQDYSGRIADEYIVIYKEEIADDAIYAHQAALTQNIKYTYNISNEYRGFSAHLTEEELSKVLDAPFVKEVHCNGIVHAYCSNRQNNVPTWGLARVAHSGALTGPLRLEYNHHSNPGQNTHIYILDTGVNAIHEEFNNRVAPGASFVDGEPDASRDLNGHGTHCAGTAAGRTHGIARNARIIPVKVLGQFGSGTFEGVVAGIDWSVNDFRGSPTRVPSVGSMSLGAGADGGMNGACTAAVNAGLPIAVAAGNDYGDACNSYPASAEGVITVGATDLGANDRDDVMSFFSNSGRCVEIFAPGSDIPSAYIPATDSYAVLSGTSMACPHVAGMSAFLLGSIPGLTPPLLTAELIRLSNKNVIVGLPNNGSPNNLLCNGCTVGPN
jgi:hypothetical protein